MIFKSLINAVFPNTCASCRSIIDENEFLCDYCMCMLEASSADKLCIKCGLPVKECRCKYNVYSFDGVIAPFYREASSRNAMYEFKFRKNEKVSRFFAERMALEVKRYYRDIKFDIIACVPMSRIARNKRGYNQSELIAKELSKILEIPFKDGLLLSHKKKRSQYRLTASERKDNLKGVFYSDSKLNGQTVLLVDDIKTTGVTLSECAKILLTIGADKVYCVTGLLSRKNKITERKK